MTLVRGLNHLTLAVVDLDRALAFYRDLLGFRLRARWSQGAYLEAGTLWLCLSVDAEAEKAVRCDYTHVAFDVTADDFAALSERAAAAAPVWKDNRSEGDSLYVLDPDRHRIELHVGGLESRLAAYRRNPPPGMVLFDDEAPGWRFHERTKAVQRLRIEPIVGELPFGLERLKREAAHEGYRFLERLATEWRSKNSRFERDGEALYGVYEGDDLVAIGGMTVDPVLSGAWRMRHFYVHPDCRGCGIGRRLATVLLDKLSAGKQVVAVNAGTAEASRFWEALGFVPDKRDEHTHVLKMR